MEPKSSYHFPNKETSLEAQAKAWELRTKAYTYEKIGEALGCSTPTAFQMVKKYREVVLAHAKETAEQLRDMEISKLDAAENR